MVVAFASVADVADDPGEERALGPIECDCVDTELAREGRAVLALRLEFTRAPQNLPRVSCDGTPQGTRRAVSDVAPA